RVNPLGFPCLGQTGVDDGELLIGRMHDLLAFWNEHDNLSALGDVVGLREHDRPVLNASASCLHGGKVTHSVRPNHRRPRRRPQVAAFSPSMSSRMTVRPFMLSSRFFLNCASVSE